MARLIDAELIKALMKNNRLLQGNCEYELWKQEVDKYVNKLPYIDIVRCKECKRHNTHKCYMAFDLIATDDDDFCSYGERKESE